MKSLRSLILMPLLLAACGGATATGPASTGSTSTGAPATQSTGGSAAPGMTTTPGGGAANGWCLNTAPEVEAALSVSGVVGTSSETPGMGGGCFYATADGTPVHAIAVVNAANFQSTFDAGKQQPGAVQISGIGKDAVLVSPQGPLVILTDKGLISMGPVGPADVMADAGAYRTAVESLGRTAVSRLP